MAIRKPLEVLARLADSPDMAMQGGEESHDF